MSLILWYKLDGDLTDSSGNSNNLTTSGVVYQAGKINTCAYLENLTKSATGSIKLLLNGVLDFTISYWIKVSGFDSSSERRNVISFGPLTTGGFHHLLHDNKVLHTLVWNNSSFLGPLLNETLDFIENTWHHIVQVNRYDTMKTYLFFDGLLVLSLAFTNDLKVPLNGDVYIGGSPANTGGSTIFNIDDVRIYNHLLSEYEVKELLKLKVLHYKFDDFQEPTENLITNPTREVIGTHEFIQYIDLAPIFDTYGTDKKYSLSLDLKSANTENASSILVYMQNGSSTRYSFVSKSVSVSEHYQRFYFENLTATLIAPEISQAKLLFYGTYGTGNYPCIKNVQLEIKDHATPFIDGSRSGNVLDCSGNKNHLDLLLTTTPQWVEESLIGKGLYLFDGSMGSYIQDYINTNLGTGDFSVSFIVSHSLLTTSHVITLGSYLLSTDGYFTVWIRNTGDIVLWIKNNVTDTDDSITLLSFIDLDTKYLITVTKDSSNMKLYINGELEGTTLCDSNAFITNKLVLGQRPDFAQNAVDGYIDDVRIYSTLLSSDDIRMLYETRMGLNINGNLSAKMLYEPPVSKGLVGWWKLDSDANDYSGYNNNGTVYGATLSTGLNGGLYSFDGSDDYISIPHIDGIIDEFSILGWAYFIDGNPNTIIGNWQDGGTGDSWLLLGHTLQYINFFVRNSTNTSGYNIAESTTYPLNEWLFYVLVFNRGEMSIYRNCNRTLYKDYCGFTSIYQNSLDTWIGRYATQYTNGKLSDIRLYNRLLAENEINLLYKIGLGLI